MTLEEATHKAGRLIPSQVRDPVTLGSALVGAVLVVIVLGIVGLRGENTRKVASRDAERALSGCDIDSTSQECARAFRQRLGACARYKPCRTRLVALVARYAPAGGEPLQPSSGSQQPSPSPSGGGSGSGGGSNGGSGGRGNGNGNGNNGGATPSPDGPIGDLLDGICRITSSLGICLK